jgi:hypothetical protein
LYLVNEMLKGSGYKMSSDKNIKSSSVIAFERPEESKIIELYEVQLVRTLEEKDFEKVAQLITNYYESDDICIGETILKNHRSMGEENCGIFVYDDGEIRGVMIVDTSEVYRNVEIKHFAVEQGENHYSICHLFLDIIINGILTEGKYKLYTKVPFENKEEMIFFIKENFIPESCLWNHVLTGEHAILFSKNIG